MLDLSSVSHLGYFAYKKVASNELPTNQDENINKSNNLNKAVKHKTYTTTLCYQGPDTCTEICYEITHNLSESFMA